MHVLEYEGNSLIFTLVCFFQAPVCLSSVFKNVLYICHCLHSVMPVVTCMIALMPLLAAWLHRQQASCWHSSVVMCSKSEIKLGLWYVCIIGLQGHGSCRWCFSGSIHSTVELGGLSSSSPARTHHTSPAGMIYCRPCSQSQIRLIFHNPALVETTQTYSVHC